MEHSYQTRSTLNEAGVHANVKEELTKEALEDVTKTPGVTKGNPLLVLLSLLALYLIWGMTYLAMRIGLEGFPPFLLASMRFLIAGSLLYTVLRLRGAPAPTRSQWIGSAIIGALLLAGSNGGVIYSEQWVASGLAAVGLAVVPLWTALFAGLWERWPTRREALGLVVGFVGVVLLNLGHGLWANPQGAIALLIAPICWSLGSIWSRHISLPAGMMSSATEMLAGGSILMIMSLGFRERTPNLMVWPSLLALAFLIVFGSLVAFSAYGYLLRHVRPALATSYAYVNPLVAVGLGALLASEQLTPLEMLAIAVILTGVGLVSLGRRRG